ncbi:peptidoglycan DD-metalloendopeptidase family protein [Aureitalea sp. L0-47]|uniref:peptidoglycan DD-metalloendopeptidase family protein n=1 Tax=Aureitalea sp. L0-47 TaxID=2816962 RepID=UPI002238E559|nr:peptidoglycan DD-metalloendopeptidase family protein [Aureitalea sp. L0-47]MCW5519609.1 peptidoglycan DD-metalloendopeptidase family protein [Aureitalea sp. L0-47]
MKLLALALLLYTQLQMAQTPAYVAVIEKFQQSYNNENSEAIFDLFNAQMKQAVNRETTSQIISSFQTRYGMMKSFDFKESEGLLEIYIGHFERGKQTIQISLDEQEQISGLLFKPFSASRPPKFERNTTKLGMPFRGKWFTVWGGDTKAQNYHVNFPSQQGAFDFLVLGKNNKTYERSGTRNEDYFAFGQPIFAVCDAEVIEVITGVEDNKPGAMNAAQPLGNAVVLKTSNDEYIFYAHFEKGTVKVEEGQMVKRGQILGNCGNSGNSSEAHLHLHIQDGPDVFSDVGAKCYFEKIMVNGELKTDYSPVRLDRISAPEE